MNIGTFQAVIHLKESNLPEWIQFLSYDINYKRSHAFVRFGAYVFMRWCIWEQEMYDVFHRLTTVVYYVAMLIFDVNDNVV